MEQVAETKIPVYGDAPLPPADAPKSPKKKRRIRARWIVLAVVVVVVAAIGIMCSQLTKNIMANLLAYDDTTVLEPVDLMHSISATGTVVSASGRNVYSMQSYPVGEIHVKLGDKVKEGDLLCTLDAQTLENQIASKELSMELSAKNAQLQVQNARNAYNANKDALDNDTNASLISAQNQVDNAYNSWVKAQETYDNYKKGNSRGENTQILQAEASVRSAQSALNQAKSAASAGGNYDPDKAQLLYEAWQAAEADLLVKQATFDADSSPQNAEYLVKAKATVDEAKGKYQLAAGGGTSGTGLSIASAQAAYDDALSTLNAVKRSASYTEDDYEKAIETAHNAYIVAQKSLTSTEASVQQQLKSSQNSLKSAQLNANTELAVMELAQMQSNLDDTKITAPISGTVTAVYATLGATGSGLLFVIEDTDQLLVETAVKEYDLSVVQTGMGVTIKSDATGSEAFEGRINTIAPASRKNAAGNIDTTGEIVFATEVGVVSRNTGLRIGMNVRLNFIAERKEQVFAVPYEAVYENAEGIISVLTLTPQDDGKFLIGELPVTTGMETDLEIEIIGEGVGEGVRVINMPDTYRLMIGQSIALSEVNLLNSMGAGGTPMVGMAVRR